MAGEERGLLLDEARRSLRPAWWAAGLFSLAYNVLLLVSPLYMLQVYDRVLTSGSLDTLLVLTVMAVGLLGVYAAADAGRRRVLSLIGRALAERLERPLFRLGMSADGGGRKLEGTIADLGRVQGLFANGVIQPLLDAPFVPMFLLFTFLVHPLLGAITLVGALILVALAIVSERAGERRVAQSGGVDRASAQFLSGISRQDAAIRTMGMARAVEQRWRGLRAAASDAGLETGRTVAFYGGISRSLRQVLQTITLGAAAWLVLRQEISAGAIIASSILAGRCLAPVDQMIGSWKPLVQARQSWARLKETLGAVPAHDEAFTPLPAPEPRLTVRELEIGHPSDGERLLGPLTLNLPPGSVLLVLGASGQGKTTLLQVLSGARAPLSGQVALGGRDLHAWHPDDRGRHIGYLPQSIDLLPGTVRENIARFSDAGPDEVISAAQRAGSHAAILTLREGYETPLAGEAGLSAGQRQGIGLARALFGDPAVLFLDEPSANLDIRSAGALVDMLDGWRKDGRTAVVASHDRRLLNAATLVLELRDGRSTLVERDAYVAALAAAAAPARLKGNAA